MSAIYPKFREQLLYWALNGGVPAGLVFKTALLDENYVYDPSHTELTDIPGGAFVSAIYELTGVTILDGVVDADDVQMSGLDITESMTAIVVFLQNLGGDSELVCYIDSGADGTIPANIDAEVGIIRWNAAGIFRV